MVKSKLFCTELILLFVNKAWFYGVNILRYLTTLVLISDMLGQLTSHSSHYWLVTSTNGVNEILYYMFSIFHHMSQERKHNIEEAYWNCEGVLLFISDNFEMVGFLFI